MTPRRGIRQPLRVIVGHCPECERVIVVENDGGVWPYVVCSCEWHGDTSAIVNRARFERGGVLIDEHHPEQSIADVLGAAAEQRERST